MINQFSIKSHIYTGPNSLQVLTQYNSQRIGIITDHFMMSSGMIDLVTEYLTHNEVKIFSDVKPDPDIDILKQGAQFFCDFSPQIIIAFGGGSSLDAAKGIVATLMSLSSFNYKIPLIAIPTTSGSGSEVTAYAVISDPILKIKHPLVSDDLLADIAILDANLVSNLPISISMDTGMDVLTHAIEAYVSKKANDFSDAFAEKAIKLVMNYLPRIYHNPHDLEAREKMHNASCLAGISFNSAGLGLVHGMAHALGAMLHIPHGKINAMLLPVVIEFNGLNNNELHQRYADCAALIGITDCHPALMIKQLVNKINKMNKQLGIPATLKELGCDITLLKNNQKHVIEAVLNDACTKNNPVPVVAEDIALLLNKIVG